MQNEYSAGNKTVHGDENTLKPDDEDKQSQRATTKGDEVSTKEILELGAKWVTSQVSQNSGTADTLEQDPAVPSHSEGILGPVHTEGENPDRVKDEVWTSPSEVLESVPTVPVLSLNTIQTDTDGNKFKHVVQDPVVYERRLVSHPITEETLGNLDVEFDMNRVRLAPSMIEILKKELDVGRASLALDFVQLNLLSMEL